MLHVVLGVIGVFVRSTKGEDVVGSWYPEVTKRGYSLGAMRGNKRSNVLGEVSL